MRWQKVTLVYCPYGRSYPVWAAFGYAKICQKYVHFKYPDGWEGIHKFEKDKVIIVPGWSEKAKQAVEMFRAAEKEYAAKREAFRRDLERWLTDLRLQKEKQWRETNPPPKFQLPTSFGGN
ncbi:MAG: hypothetical protein DRI61_16005 [Chloroflexi bacterium]|nr:MAG: hypothetical protein DRI61_16005 [Chloroflexota bacterium]